MSDYSSIMDHPHHQSATRPRMSMTARAAQFSPFAALSGYGEAVDETARLTEEKVILDEDAALEINRKLMMTREAPAMVAITYFAEDVLKEGGTYVVSTGEVKKLDAEERKVIMNDGTVIPVEDIFDISFI